MPSLEILRRPLAHPARHRAHPAPAAGALTPANATRDPDAWVTHDDLRDKLLDPFTIGALTLDRGLLMAPMAGITGPAFRRSVRGYGAGLVFTEMISAQGIIHDNHHTLAYLACTPADHPIGFQLFAAEPAVLARARRVLAAGADLIDLNLACPVRKVMKTGAGAALLDAPDLAVACVRAVVEEVAGEAPVTVKIRAGVRAGDEAGLRAAPRLVAAGAAAVCIHPRYADQLYKGTADHRLTLALARELPVPVIASGDIATLGPDGRVDRTSSAGLLDGGVAAVMVARAALGRPWVFAQKLEGRPAAARRAAARPYRLRRRRERRAGLARGGLPAPLLAAVPPQRRHTAGARGAAHGRRRPARRRAARAGAGRRARAAGRTGLKASASGEAYRPETVRERRAEPV